MSERELSPDTHGEPGPQSESPFEADTEVTKLTAPGESDGADRYEVALNRRWWVRRGPNGGYAAAVMLRALQASAGSREPRTLTVQFPQAPDEGRAEIEVASIREGRSISYLEASMAQGGETVVRAQATFGGKREAAIEFTGVEATLPDDAEEPGELVSLDASNRVPPVFANFSFRAFGPMPLSGSEGEARSMGWITPREPHPVDAPLATAILDVWFPAPYVKLERPVPAPTLSYSVHFLTALPLPESEADDPYLIEVKSSVAREGYSEERARLWHRDGTLIAHASQVALV